MQLLLSLQKIETNLMVIGSFKFFLYHYEFERKSSPSAKD